eukprot:12834827-Alexandrium_andersonii.AAC.1
MARIDLRSGGTPRERSAAVAAACPLRTGAASRPPPARTRTGRPAPGVLPPGAAPRLLPEPRPWEGRRAGPVEESQPRAPTGPRTQ